MNMIMLPGSGGDVVKCQHLATRRGLVNQFRRHIMAINTEGEAVM